MFNYTEKRENLDSSLVRNVYFDSNTNSMLVELDSGASYVYDNVGLGAYGGIVSAASPGRAYNNFRRTRPRGQGGRPFAGATAKRAGLVTTTSAYATGPGSKTLPPAQYASGGILKSRFEVSYAVDGRTYSSTVEATDLVAAAQDVQGKANSLGLNAKLTGVVVKN